MLSDPKTRRLRPAPDTSAGTKPQGRRGRPSLVEMADRGETRLGLLKAARDLMIANDTVDFTLSQLASATGQSPALVKYHFGNKEGLLLALIELDATTAVAGMTALQATDLPVEQQMRLHIHGLINAYFRAPYANRLLQALMQSSSPEEARRVSDSFMKPVADFQAGLLERGVREGVFRPMEPIEFFFIVVGSCDHFFSRRSAMAHLFGVDEINADLKNSYSRTLADIVMKGIAAEAA